MELQQSHLAALLRMFRGIIRCPQTPLFCSIESHDPALVLSGASEYKMDPHIELTPIPGKTACMWLETLSFVQPQGRVCLVHIPTCSTQSDPTCTRTPHSLLISNESLRSLQWQCGFSGIYSRSMSLPLCCFKESLKSSL